MNKTKFRNQKDWVDPTFTMALNKIEKEIKYIYIVAEKNVKTFQNGIITKGKLEKRIAKKVFWRFLDFKIGVFVLKIEAKNYENIKTYLFENHFEIVTNKKRTSYFINMAKRKIESF